ncbi:MAG: VapC toxin family PIN domain ribonuclease [Acidobacteria bacterium]|nr:MAG: VapC toxin family PIN domain ribonuclease [Acidobacteriota bacterium]
MIFVDTNVPVYLIGAHHPHKADAQRLLERATANHERLVTDAEVLQEILHRYVSLDRRDAIQPAFDLLMGVVDEIFPIDRAAVERAKAVVLGYPTLSARDAIHVATMQEHGVARIMTFDSGFDAVSVISRIRL